MTEPPDRLEAAGRALWGSVTGTYTLEQHEAEVLAQACRVADLVAALDAVVDREGVLLADPKRGQIVHPALVEARQQRLSLARLLTALRLPDEGDRRPQRRGLRGVYGPPRVVPGGA
jgi:hypothetical protein